MSPANAPLDEDSVRPSQALLALLRDMVREPNAIRRPDGSAIEFKTPRDAYLYRYFKGAKGAQYCWTIHPCDRGRYYAFTYRPVGKGSRSGKAKRWKLVDLVSFARRNKAKARALKRCLEDERKAGHVLPPEAQSGGDDV